MLYGSAGQNIDGQTGHITIVCYVVQCVMHNVSQTDMEEGQQQFIMYGAEYEKNRCSQLIQMWETTFFFGRQST